MTKKLDAKGNENPGFKNDFAVSLKERGDDSSFSWPFYHLTRTL